MQAQSRRVCYFQSPQGTYWSLPNTITPRFPLWKVFADFLLIVVWHRGFRYLVGNNMLSPHLLQTPKCFLVRCSDRNISESFWILTWGYLFACCIIAHNGINLVIIVSAFRNRNLIVFSGGMSVCNVSPYIVGIVFAKACNIAVAI